MMSALEGILEKNITANMSNCECEAGLGRYEISGL